MALVVISGPDNDAPFQSSGETVAECLQPYLTQFSAEIMPYDGSEEPGFDVNEEAKYFWYSSPICRFLPVLVDIHIERNGIEICLKQDLQIPVHEGDSIFLGVLVC